jgi:hypothetical protein
MNRVVTQILAPSSLSLQIGVSIKDPKEQSVLLPGDIVLLQTPGLAYKSFREATGNLYDHVLVALTRSDQCLHVSPPQARRVRTRQILTFDRQPRIFRPKLSLDERLQFAKECENFLGKDYDLPRMYSTIIRSIAEKQLKIGRFLPKLTVPTANTTSSWLCSDAIMVALLKSSPTIRKACEAPLLSTQLDFFRTGTASINDFLVLMDHDLLEEIFVIVPPNSSKSKDTTAERLAKAWEEAGKAKISLRTLAFGLLVSSLFNKRVFLLRFVMLLAFLWAIAKSYSLQSLIPTNLRASL